MLHLTIGFGVSMGWAQVRILPFASHLNLRTRMLPTNIKRYASKTFMGNLGLENPIIKWFIIL
jgi:hypothetical protein